MGGLAMGLLTVAFIALMVFLSLNTKAIENRNYGQWLNSAHFKIANHLNVSQNNIKIEEVNKNEYVVYCQGEKHKFVFKNNKQEEPKIRKSVQIY
jgi:hypothetical protein